MGRPQKTERNLEIVRMRNKNPDYYSWRKLGSIFEIKHITARDIYLRESGRGKEIKKQVVNTK